MPSIMLTHVSLQRFLNQQQPGTVSSGSLWAFVAMAFIELVNTTIVEPTGALHDRLSELIVGLRALIIWLLWLLATVVAVLLALRVPWPDLVFWALTHYGVLLA